jgi:hypothetical protein
MAVFFFKLSHKDKSPRLVATCTVQGEDHGYAPHVREFDSASQAVKALSKAGINSKRFGKIPARTRADWTTSFEISHNEAQRLDVLHTDSPE